MASLLSDPYETLGVARNAQLPEIRSAHRKLILKCHPDKIQDPQLKAEKEAEFHRVQQAYELLSDEVARSNYDRKEREKANMSSSPPSARMSSRAKPHFEPEIRTAEPRPSTFAKTRASPASKVYGAGYPASRSYEDELGGSSSRGFDDIRRAKKSASYSTSYERAERDRGERERERERERAQRDREWEHEREKYRREEERRKRKEDELIRERVKAQKEAMKEVMREAEEKKKKERKDKEKDKKKADKERKKDVEDKHRRHKAPYAEHYHDTDSDDAPNVTEKKSSSRKLDEAEQAAAAATERERKNSANLESAIRYLERSGSHAAAPTGRSPPYTESTKFRHVQAPPAAAPTPPPATSAVHPPPPMAQDIDDEDTVRRPGRSSRAKPPDALRSSKDKSRRSSSRSASKEGVRVVEVGRTPSDRSPPKLNKSYSDPPKIVRSYTEGYARPTPQAIPTLNRQNTWQEEDRYAGARGRRMASWEEESGDDDIYRNRRMHSPEPMVSAQTTHRYAVADGKVRRKYAPEPVPIPSRSRKSKHASANTSTPRADPASAGMYYADEYADVPSHPAFEKVKYAPVVNAEEVQYSTVPRYSSSYGKEAYAAQAY